MDNNIAQNSISLTLKTGNFKKMLKDKIKAEHPDIDLVSFDKIYAIISQEMHKNYRMTNCICYDKRCPNRRK